MACSKYILTNTGSTVVEFNYRRCDDSMWEYQVPLLPNQTKNIWLIDNTYSVAPLFKGNISLTNTGVFPPLNATMTPTPSPTTTPTNTPTPTTTPTNTPTPSVTATNTATPTNTQTPTVTSTNTPSVTPTNTPTVTSTNTPTNTQTNTPTNTTTNTPTPSNTPTYTPTSTVTPTITPSPTPVGPGSINFVNAFLQIQPGFTATTQDFSVEFWMKTTDPTTAIIPLGPVDANTGNLTMQFDNFGTRLFVQSGSTSYENYLLPSALQANTWTYVAISRTGTTENVWIDGVACGSPVTDNSNYLQQTYQIGNSIYCTTKMTDIKVNIGASYIDPNNSTITVPTSQLTADAETVFLYNANDAATFLDDNSGNQTLQITGGTSITYSIDSPYA